MSGTAIVDHPLVQFLAVVFAFWLMVVLIMSAMKALLPSSQDTRGGIIDLTAADDLMVGASDLLVAAKKTLTTDADKHQA